MLRMAICDDEDYVCSSLERYIMACCASMLIDCEIDIYTTGEGFIKKLKSDNSYHLIFLDIELKKCSGIDVSDYIRNTLHNETMQIAYVSGKDGYDRQLFTFRPFHFIDKPFDQHSITVVIEKYLRIYGNKSDIFQYKVGHDKYWVKIEDIMYFKSNDRKVIIRTIRLAFLIRLDLPSTCPTRDNPLGVISLSSLTTYSIFRIFDFTLRVLFAQRFFCFYFTIFTLVCTVPGRFSFAESGYSKVRKRPLTIHN